MLDQAVALHPKVHLGNVQHVVEVVAEEREKPQQAGEEVEGKPPSWPRERMNAALLLKVDRND